MACDVFTVETARLRTLYVLVFIELGEPADPPQPINGSPRLRLGHLSRPGTSP
jgi:hypothetical protein